MVHRLLAAALSQSVVIVSLKFVLSVNHCVMIMMLLGAMSHVTESFLHEHDHLLLTVTRMDRDGSVTPRN